MTASLWILSAILGLRHAFEPDHMAAVATLMTGAPQRRGAAARLGASWGFGHAAALLAMATLLAVAQSQLHRSTGAALELLVGAMLIVLGGVRVAAALRAAPPAADAPAGRSFSVGIVHGLAGSGALTVLAASQVATTHGRLAFVATFGLGSIVGMALLSGAAGGLLARLGHRPAVARALSGLAGAFSVGLGVAWLATHAAELVPVR